VTPEASPRTLRASLSTGSTCCDGDFPWSPRCDTLLPSLAYGCQKVEVGLG
jgi:hypothetical protein